MGYPVTVDSMDLLLVLTAAKEARDRLNVGEAHSSLTAAITRIVDAGNSAFREHNPASVLGPAIPTERNPE